MRRMGPQALVVYEEDEEVGGSTVSNRTQVAENPEEHPAEYPAEPLVEERRSLEKATLTCECMVKRRKDVGGDMLLAWERAPSLMLGPRTLHAGPEEHLWST
ncbi:hypothetical protein GUITHDRAFT_120834 [Guillardia theta CCMP2712]|uniref:Uncharacterized protein n=1 Tax=Guillardia theta (strain CCMP2712) TaxID=905079 RepID=L1I9S1_GUITC|nr:hypothetical protein GUITHDRAFT_120834 [Guillardia theta CCMP2712]EKX33001.1 hypothetical protein GUITHDRAFT_120834 [Guillardia theta CCMP2712]|eukprot:XP_005819981.1 hypothetical protein GUITHDRAFT_120834 [Guillardia theta CCMP2712]